MCVFTNRGRGNLYRGPMQPLCLPSLRRGPTERSLASLRAAPSPGVGRGESAVPPAPPRRHRRALTGLSSPAEENEERMMIDPTSKDDPKFKELVKVRGASVSAFLLGCDEGSGKPRREGWGPPW